MRSIKLGTITLEIVHMTKWQCRPSMLGIRFIFILLFKQLLQEEKPPAALKLRDRATIPTKNEHFCLL